MDKDDHPVFIWDGGTIPLRNQWRVAQIAARQLDCRFPRWWDNKSFHDDFLPVLTPGYRRFWVELIRQRQGL